MRYRPLVRLARYVLIAGLLLVFLVLQPSSGTHAQIGGTIGYGGLLLGTVTRPDQLLTYSFNGSVGDSVQITVRNWTGTVDPAIEIVMPDGVTALSRSNNPFSDDLLEAALSLFLPQSGVYSLRISGDQGTTGEFILRLQGRAAVDAIELLYGLHLDAFVPVSPPQQYYEFETQDCPTILTLTNLSDGLPFTFPFFATVRDEQGTQIAQFYGGDAVEDRLLIPALSGRYEVAVSSADPDVSGSVELLVSCADQAPACVPGSSGGESGVRACRPCFDDDFGGDVCDAFTIDVERSGGTVVFNWTPVEGAEWYIFSVIDASGGLLMDSPRLIEDGTTHTYIFNPADLPRGPFTAFVSAGAETDDPDYLCVAEVDVSFDGDVTDTCTGITVGADIVPGGPRAAVVHWTAVPGAQAHLIHVYAVADDGGLIGIRVLTVPGDATTYHISDLFPAEYDQYLVRVAAYSEASGGGAFGDMPQGYLCDGEVNITFGPIGPVEWGPAV